MENEKMQNYYRQTDRQTDRQREFNFTSVLFWCFNKIK